MNAVICCGLMGAIQSKGPQLWKGNKSDVRIIVSQASGKALGVLCRRSTDAARAPRSSATPDGMFAVVCSCAVKVVRACRPGCNPTLHN